MPERIPLDARRLADLAERVAAHLGPAMLAEDAPEPPPLAQAAWQAMNALQRVAELLPDGQLAGEPDTRLRSLNDLASHGETIVQAAMECLIAEGHSAPVVKRPGDGPGTNDAARPEAATIDISFTRGSTLSLELEGDLRPGELLRLAGRSDSALRDLDPHARQAATAAVAEIAYVLVSALSEISGDEH
jgi:hypothetical protein